MQWKASLACQNQSKIQQQQQQNQRNDQNTNEMERLVLKSQPPTGKNKTKQKLRHSQTHTQQESGKKGF